MSADQLRSFRFSTAKQWSSCLFVQADGHAIRAGSGVQPFAPFGRRATLFASPGGYAPAVTRAGEILWRDSHHCLHLLAPCDDAPEIVSPPAALDAATRIVASSSGLWVSGESPDSLQRYEDDSLARILTVDLGDERVVDIADEGRDSVFALVERDGVWRAVRVDPAGHVVRKVTLTGIAEATAFVYLRTSKRFVVLAGVKHQRLFWFDKTGKALFSRPVAAMRACFKADVLGADRSGRICLGGAEGEAFGARPYVVILDEDGNLLGDVPIDPQDGPITGVAASRKALLVTGPRGLLSFPVAERVPDEAGQARCIVMTPMLNAPDREDRRRWLRIDATAHVPEGSTLEITFAATDDGEVRDRLNRIAGDTTVTASQRVAAMRSEPDVWHETTQFHGGNQPIHGEPDPLSAKLFEITERYVWVCVTLTAAAGASLPRLSQLDVLYPGRTLMESLPSIYQREEERPGSFLRSLVGVLEATTQGIDSRIGAMGSHLSPTTAPEPWLNFVARWLGVPWDDAMSVDLKRRILMRAAQIARGRGTRAGLEAFLEALMPGSPRRFRVTDATADFGFAAVGGNTCTGSSLPAMLGGQTRWRSELGSQAVLGCMRLPCPGQIDDGVWHLAGRIRLEIAASGMERKSWEPWLEPLIREMVPLTARVKVRWVSPYALRSNRLDGTLTLEPAPNPHLGTDAITSVAVLPERGARISASGPRISSRLR
jgi:phage tail-like protein